MNSLRKRMRRRRGFSLVEAMIATVIFLVVLGAVYGTVNSGQQFSAVQKTMAKAQMDARKALERITSELRMSGWRQNPAHGEPPYPHIFTNGAASGAYADESHAPPAQHVGPGNPAYGDVREIVFKIPVDLDGDGLPTDGTTGEVEWCPYDVSYVLVTDAGGVNTLLRREDGVTTEILARHVERITFDTVYTDASLAFDEIAVTIWIARPAPNGLLIQTSLSTCVTMRNVADAS